VDSCVWRSLYYGQLIESLFGLEVTLHAPDVILDDLYHEPDPDYLLGLGLDLVSLPGAAVMDAIRQHPELSAMDASCLVLSRDRGWLLVTQDRPLYEVARSEGVEVRDTVWAVEHMVLEGVLARQEALKGLQAMQKKGRVPRRNWERLVAQWGSSSKT
jgi:hypothetical protein